MNNPIIKTNGKAEWIQKEGDSYLVTGIDRSGKRFKRQYDSWFFARCINVWQGSKWLLRDGKRYLIQRVIN